MCRPTVTDITPMDAQALHNLQQRLQQLGVSNGNPGAAADLDAAARGSGPRVFCGHVPPECSEELVKAHFSQWGHVLDVYFPKRKDTFRRRPFCFVTFARLEDAQRAVAESPMNICGIAIKQLNLVEDRSDYYKHRHTAAQGALVQALQTLALMGADAGHAAPGAPARQAPSADLSNMAALLALDNVAAAQRQALCPQAYPPHAGAAPLNCYAATPARFVPAPLPFANLPGFNHTGLTGQVAPSLAMPLATPSYNMQPPATQPLYAPPLSAAALSVPGPLPCRTSGGSDWSLPLGASSPFSTLDATQHASAASSPPRSDQFAHLAAAMCSRGSGLSASSGAVSPDSDASANGTAMWQLQTALLAGESGRRASRDWA